MLIDYKPNRLKVKPNFWKDIKIKLIFIRTVAAKSLEKEVIEAGLILLFGKSL